MVPVQVSPEGLASRKGNGWDDLFAAASQAQFSPVVAFAGPSKPLHSRRTE